MPIVPQSWAFSVVEFIFLAKTTFRVSLSKYAYTPSKAVETYCDYIRENIKRKSGQRHDFVLVDCFSVPQWIMANSIFLNRLCEQLDTAIASYGFAPREHTPDFLYRSFGAENHFRVSLTSAQRRRRNEIYLSIFKNSRTPEQLFNLHIDGIWVGLDLYESILRSGTATVNMDSYKARFTIYHGLRHFIFFYDLIQSGRVKAVAPSHDCYATVGLLAKVAQRFGVPVFYANPMTIMRSFKPHDLYQKYLNYPEIFASLPTEEQVKVKKSAKDALAKRVGGSAGVNMFYSTKSAFTSNKLPRQTTASSKLKIIVATHCFYDNPHAYGKMTFRDFYQWLEFLGEISRKTDYEWYLKTHPDYRAGTLEILHEFMLKHPKFKLVDSNTTFHQLKEEGVSIALTAYGSIGHELPFLGYHVINASYNPHSRYKFNINCKSREEYEDVLMNLDALPPIKDIEKIYEFYATHHYLTESDNLLFESLSDYFTFADGDFLSDSCYEYFMRTPYDNIQRYSQHSDEFLASDYHYDFEMLLAKLGGST